MNNVNLIGRLTKDPEVRYSQNNTAVARFSVAINRGKDKNGNDLGADYPNIVVFGRQAENVGQYMSKGRMIGISGYIKTGSYTNREGNKVYTTDVIATRVDFLGGNDQTRQNPQQQANTQQNPQRQNNQQQDNAPEGWERLDDDDIPF